MIEVNWFPAVSAAIERMKAVRSLPVYDRRQEERRVWLQANEAYADQLLPRLLGNAWAWSSDCGSMCELMRLPLFDHGQVFRRKGAKGPHGWGNCAIVAHPYTASLGRVDEQLAQLFWKNVGVCAHDDLSAYLPGSTTLVIAAMEVKWSCPQARGFRVLEPNDPALRRRPPPMVGTGAEGSRERE